MTPTPQDAVVVLADRDLAGSAALFPADRQAASRPGLYSWWVDDEGRAALEGTLESPLTSLIYAGQAGATSSISARASGATLYSRIRNNHIRGNAGSSTFRKTISALLLEPLDLKVDRPDILVGEDNLRVSQWIHQHLSVAIFPYDDRGSLGVFEHQVLRILDPPLNLNGMDPTPRRTRLRMLRSRIGRPTTTETTQAVPTVPPPTPPRTAASDRITLHEELVAILNEHGNHWMTTQELADQVNRRGRYHKRDASEVTAFQIHGRTKNYSHLFERDGSRVRLHPEQAR
jgi:hypothetical protein